MAIAKINGINLYYESKGSGDPILFIPGLGGSTELWRYQIDFFQKNYRVIAMDNRGGGRSGKPFEIYSMHRFARDVEELLDYLEIDEPVTLVGASMGGIIAQAFIHYYPKRVKKLVLACSGVSLGDPHITVPASYVQQKIISPGATPEQKVATYLELFYHPEFVASHPEIRESFMRMNAEPQPTFAYMAQFAACADPKPYYHWLKKIDVPVLVIHGSDDIVWPVQNAHTLISGLGKHAELAIIGNAAHMLMQEKPTEFNSVLQDFLAKE